MKRWQLVLLVVGGCGGVCACLMVVGLIGAAVGLLPDTGATSTAEMIAQQGTQTVIALTPSNTPSKTPIPSDTPIPTETFTPSVTPLPTNTVRPSATFTHTPEPTETPDMFKRDLSEVEGVREIGFTSVVESDGLYQWLVYLEVVVEDGYNNTQTATLLRAKAYTETILSGGGTVDFTVILDDCRQAMAYTFDNDDGDWRVTNMPGRADGCGESRALPGGSGGQIVPMQEANTGFACDCSKTCTQILTCEEAKSHLSCGCNERDADDDGVPCENICPGG